MSEPMTPDELNAKLAAECPFWSTQDWRAFLAMSPADQQTVATAMAQSSQPPSVNAWTIAGGILKGALGVVADVSGLASGIDVVKMVAKL